MAAKENGKGILIDRRVSDKKVLVEQLRIGQVFERQGSLHMVVAPVANVPMNHIEGRSINPVAVCNLNSGSVWYIPGEETADVVRDPQFTYTVEL
jgi:hypothetical protein